MTDAIRLDGIRKSYRTGFWMGRTDVLRGVTLAVAPNEIHGFLGPNGAGKTTTIKIITSLVRPDGGDVEIFGKRAADPESRARLGFLPEHPYFYDYLLPGEFLRFAGGLSGNGSSPPREEIDRLLALVGLSDAKRLPLRKFSKGMLQRIGVAQALVHDPELLILDEPMSGLDPLGRAEMRDIILDLKRAGKTVFFSTHIIADLEQLVDRVSIIHRGEMVASGAIDDLLRESITGFRVTVKRGDGGRTETLAAAGEDELRALLRERLSRGDGILSVQPVMKSLETFFQEIVGGAR